MTIDRSALLAAVFDEVADAAARQVLAALAWQELAACGARPDLPWTADEVGTWEAETMRAVCGACPVQAECSAYADSTKVCAGWWAGHDRDTDHVESPAPAWVPVAGHRRFLPGVEQGVLPLGGAA